MRDVDKVMDGPREIAYNTCPPWVNWIVLMSLSSSIALLAGSVLHPSWVRLDSTTLGLISCSDCQGSQKNWTWECFDSMYCDKLQDDLNCTAYHHSFSASFWLLNLDFMAFFFSLMILERFLSYTLGRDYGMPRLLYALAGVTMVLHLVAVIAYFVISKASFTGDGSISSPQALGGPALSISTLLLLCFSLIFLLIVFRRRDLTSDSGLWGAALTTYKRVSIRTWMHIVLAGIVVSYCLMIAGMVTTNWVRRDDEGELWRGGLLRCEGCPHITQEIVRGM